ncbi:MAG TPA: HEAT repeat domain-containing protein [Acidobacteriaceae bacterium]
MTAEELRTKLSMIEPTEAMYQGIGSGDVPALEQIISDPEEWMASRAVFALSRVGGPAVVNALVRAAADQRSPVRVAVAAAVSQRALVLPDTTLLNLLKDPDAGVRKFATLAVKSENGADARTLLSRMTTEDAVSTVRDNAAEALRRIH